jgi:hypothetical protein
MKSLDSSPPTSRRLPPQLAVLGEHPRLLRADEPDGTVAQQIQYLQQNGMGKYVPYYQGITTRRRPTRSRSRCGRPASTRAVPAAGVNFFGWHRMYLYYFERVLRWAAQDDTLRLPYWDYTDPAQLALPAEFRQTAAVVYDASGTPA